jgi:hypothetical protein
MESKSDPQYHIVTPFYRVENEEFLRKNTEGFIWHKVEGSLPDFKDPAYAKINYFIQKYPIVDDDYYQILMDDDALPENFIETTRRIKGDIVVFSMKRGSRIPGSATDLRAHPTYPLMAEPRNMVPCEVGLQQIRMKGSIFKTIICDDHPYADGRVAEKLAKDHSIVYVSNVYILFNYLEPGRWEKQ